MGGHGGLNILPQKRWNVYNFDNREKVKRDEEEAARQEAIEKQQDRHREAEARLEKLREAAQAKKRDPSELRITEGAEQPLPEQESEREDEDSEAVVVEAARPQHFNLFEIAADPSEKAKGSKDWINDLKVHNRGGLDKQDIRELKRMEKAVRAPEDEGYEFGCGLVGKSGKKPWYSTKRFMVDRTSGQSDRVRKRRSSSPDEERSEKRSRRKEEKLEKHAKRKEKKATTGRKSMEELRAERVQREQQERDKARKAVITNRNMNGGNEYGNVNPSGRPYYYQSFGNAR